MMDESSYTAEDRVSDFRLIPGDTEELLNQRQLEDYRRHRERLLTWVLERGMDPENYEGYSESTAKNRMYRLDKFYRWVWDEEDGYTKHVTHDHADRYLIELAKDQEVTESHKSKCLKALKMYFRWKEDIDNTEAWEPEISFSSDKHSARDHFTKDERKRLREASLEYKTVTPMEELDMAELTDVKVDLAQRYGVSYEDVGEREFRKANGWKIPSLVAVSLDAGLRPVEVENASVEWLDLDNGRLLIPHQESSKNRENWDIALTSDTVDKLQRWQEERSTYPMYEDTDALWLTRYGNRYQSSSLRRLLHNLCEIADIDAENRQISWYTVRHSTGTYMAHHGSLESAGRQLRHRSKSTTMIYDNAPIELRKNVLDKVDNESI